jgi:hypothetical protein
MHLAALISEVLSLTPSCILKSVISQQPRFQTESGSKSSFSLFFEMEDSHQLRSFMLYELTYSPNRLR